MNRQQPFKWRHFQQEIILLNVRWYLKYPLSYRNLEEMMKDQRVEGGALDYRSLGTSLFS